MQDYNQICLRIGKILRRGIRTNEFINIWGARYSSSPMYLQGQTKVILFAKLEICWNSMWAVVFLRLRVNV